MKIKMSLALAAAGFALGSTLHAGSFAGSVVEYNPGIGISPGYTDTEAVVGPPSTADAYGDAVDPFDPPYATNQILALGTNGSLTVKFAQPIVSGVPGNPFGLDFIIFGDSFFIVTNAEDSDYNYIGTPSTGGAVYSDGCQATVSVSSDGVTFYKLNPAQAPPLNYLFPTDGEGNFNLPVNPALTNLTNFAGLTLAQIRALYNGSAGGAGYSISWAQDTDGKSVSLFEISYIRVDVQSGQALLAGFAAVSNPNQVFVEDFSHNPALDGWEYFGDTNLLTWSAANQNLQVTWDSSQSNSYFHHPLGTILSTNDNFSLSFNLTLTDYAATGYSFQVAAGLQNIAEATNAGYLVGTGANAPDLAEFDFFPETSYPVQASVSPTFIDSENDYYYNGASTYDYALLPTNILMRVAMVYTATNQTCVLTVTTNGGPPVAQVDAVLDGPGVYFNDYHLDSFAVETYNGLDSGGTLLAHGTIGDIVVVVPPPPVTCLQAALSNGAGQVRFASVTNWNYVLMSSTNLITWTTNGPMVPGTGGNLLLRDTNSLLREQFYRVDAVRQD